MKRQAVVDIPAGQGYVACVLLGDGEKPGRAWICVHNTQLPATRAWLGCWSYEAGASTEVLRELLVQLVSEISQHARVGPMGPFLGETYFFDGWQIWGIGTPTPLVGVSPAELLATPDDHVAIEEVSI
ncbi:hypothetical protein KGQ19_06070 [Catenulispora sp. NL8]|uniref:Uncharacterized protein n=1 Tax=Catenulispora pinistramenti TaxID=2705254 RepID=A0ABS5KJF2_9ACTN|nr:hypothetical protein [Catenulispora pinistramenti]MBS2546428.1 hypothetical protein [Catenulispora pinistramenti]